MKELDRIKDTKGLALSKSTSGNAGKTMALMGAGVLIVPLLAAFIPFVGAGLLGIILLVAGVLMWE